MLMKSCTAERPSAALSLMGENRCAFKALAGLAQAQHSPASSDASNSRKVHLKHDPDFLNRFPRSDDT
jgi:hypothetical protein